MIGMITGLVLGALAIAVSFSSDPVAGWGPFFALCAGGALHITWTIRHEPKDVRSEPQKRAA